MSDVATAVHEERARRSAGRAAEALYVVCGGRPQTPRVSADRAAIFGSAIAEWARVVVDTWATCGGSVPQPLSNQILELKGVLQLAASKEEDA